MAEKEAEAAEQAAAAEKAKAPEQGAESDRKTKEAEAAKAKDGKTVPLADYEKLQSDLENFKRIEEERKGKERTRQEALLKEQGKFKELYETTLAENTAMKARLEKLDGVIKTELEEEMKSLPDDFDKTLIPEGNPHDQLTWLRKAKPLLIAKAEPRRGDGTPPAAGKTTISDMRSIYNHPTSPKR